MNEPFDCVSRDILVTWNISLRINHVLDRSYNKDIKAAGRLLPVRGAGHFVEGFIIKILIGLKIIVGKVFVTWGVIENKFHKSLMWQSWIVNTDLIKATA